MATLIGNQEDEKRREREAFLRGQGTGQNAPGITAGGRNLATPSAPQQQAEATQSGVYTDIGKYTRNQSPAAYGMARQLGEGIRNKTQADIGTATQNAIQQFTGGISPSTFDPALLQQYITNPAGASPELEQQIRTWRTGGYTGPESLEQAGLTGAIDDVVSGAERDVGKLTSETGLADLLRRYGDYGPGGGKLSIDLALLRRDPTARTYLGDLNQELNTFTADQRANAQQNAQKAVEEATQGFTEAQRQTQTQLEQALSGRRGQVASEYEDMLARNSQQYQQIRNAVSSGQNIDDAQLADLGVSRQQWGGLQNTINQIVGGVSPTYNLPEASLRQLMNNPAIVGTPEDSWSTSRYNDRGRTGAGRRPNSFNINNWDSATMLDYINNYALPQMRSAESNNPVWWNGSGGWRGVSRPTRFNGGLTTQFTGDPVRGSADLGQFATPGTPPEISRSMSREQAAALQALNGVLGTTPQYNLNLAGAYTPDIANFDFGGAQSYLGNITQQLNNTRDLRTAELQGQAGSQLGAIQAYANAIQNARRSYDTWRRGLTFGGQE